MPMTSRQVNMTPEVQICHAAHRQLSVYIAISKWYDNVHHVNNLNDMFLLLSDQVKLHVT